MPSLLPVFLSLPLNNLPYSLVLLQRPYKWSMICMYQVGQFDKYVSILTRKTLLLLILSEHGAIPVQSRWKVFEGQSKIQGLLMNLVLLLITQVKIFRGHMSLLPPSKYLFPTALWYLAVEQLGSLFKFQAVKQFSFSAFV